ncbi:hypothetical protein R77592_00681 [Ralstonia mannitolilytica]|uniref:major capsid protein n=1 Tax=Ralstonia mannitolilytica TaxID=105219 RepID=UPI0028F67B5D|nr:major capsid protein [Ralstonia mannitolilytica]CAJ0725537.1 hypothetical protein R77592_00681 [Ralstonia mannitolilytica]
MQLVHLASRLYGTPLLIARPKLDVILSVLGSRIGLPDLDMAMPLPMPRQSATPGQAGIAVIPVVGTLVRRSMGIEAASGLMSYGEIEARLDAALADPQVAGILLDLDSPGGEASGVFELADLFDEFDITAQSVSFEFSTAADNGQIKTACLELLGLMEDGLTGEFSTGVHVLCSTEFFRALTTHKEVKTAYQNWQQGAVLINDMRSGFSYSGITFEEYRGQASFVQADGTLGSRRFIAAGEAHAFPVGTVDTFATYFAPADFNETVNTIGQPLYAKQEPRKFDRGTDLHTQSNPLPMCHRPGVLIKLVAA